MNKFQGMILISVLILFVLSGCATSAAAPTSNSEATPTPLIAPQPAQATAVQVNPTVSGPVSPLAKPGTFDETIDVGGQSRKYTLHIPSGYDGSQSVPLVIVLHGLGGTAPGIMNSSSMNDKADEKNFIVLYPDGSGNPRGWNNGIMSPATTNMDDVAFVRALIKKFIDELHVNPKRVYVAGFSNGAAMTYRLGAELSGQLAAIAIVEGAIGTHQGGSALAIPQPAGPLPILIFHGKQDRTIPYDGGKGADGVDYFSVANALDLWTKNDGCTQPPQKILVNGNVQTEDYQGCAAGSEVLLYTIGTGHHAWPTVKNDAGFSGTDVIWDFFSKHP
jgi:polyhydroxybutyrate depolymerase